MNITPTPIPINNIPEPFRGKLFGMFQHIIDGLKGFAIPFTRFTMWDYIIWLIVAAAAIKAFKLMYGKGDSTHHE